MSEEPNPYQPPSAPVAPAAGQADVIRSLSPCFKCGNSLARKVKFTWWGGLIGPKMFHHVKCVECGQLFNSKSGRSNSTAIAIYFIVTLTLALAVIYSIR